MAGDDELVKRLENVVVPVDGTSPESPLNDLEPLSDVFGDKRIVALGESTHGTREFFQLKHRLVRFLVTELDFRLFALEANFPETLAINDYVVSGRGDAKAVLDGIYFWTWNTKEMLSLVEWLRAYNDGRPEEDCVKFYGYDMKFAQGAATAIAEFLERVDPDYLNVVGDDLDSLSSGRPSGGLDEVKTWLVTAEAVVTKLRQRFKNREESYRSKMTEREWRLVNRQRTVIDQARELTAVQTFDSSASPNAVRDAYMAENVSWILDHEDADHIVLWAHNGHVKTGYFGDWNESVDEPPDTMGQHLREAYSDDYYALGFEFGRGAFQALPDPETADELSVRAFSIDSIPDSSVPAVLSRVDGPATVLDVESATSDPRVREWLDGESRMHNIGSIYDPKDAYRTVSLADEFDGLLFVDETERSVPVSRE